MANERARANEKVGQKEGIKEKALWMHQLIPLLIPSSILLFRLYFYFALLWFTLVFGLVLIHVSQSLFKTASLLIFFFFMNNLELCMLLITRKT